MHRLNKNIPVLYLTKKESEVHLESFLLSEYLLEPSNFYFLRFFYVHKLPFKNSAQDWYQRFGESTFVPFSQIGTVCTIYSPLASLPGSIVPEKLPTVFSCIISIDSPARICPSWETQAHSKPTVLFPSSSWYLYDQHAAPLKWEQRSWCSGLEAEKSWMQTQILSFSSSLTLDYVTQFFGLQFAHL